MSAFTLAVVFKAIDLSLFYRGEDQIIKLEVAMTSLQINFTETNWQFYKTYSQVSKLDGELATNWPVHPSCPVHFFPWVQPVTEHGTTDCRGQSTAVWGLKEKEDRKQEEQGKGKSSLHQHVSPWFAS